MIKAQIRKTISIALFRVIGSILLPMLFTGCGSKGFTGSTVAPTVSISANPASIAVGISSTLTIATTTATQLTVTGSDGTTYSLQASGGTLTVSPKVTTTYTHLALAGKHRPPQP